MYITSNTVQIFIVLVMVNIRISLSQFNKPWNDKFENMCPKLYPKYFRNNAPAGEYFLLKNINNTS